MTARRIVLTTSLVDVQPEIQHFAPFVGTSVFHCPLCDAAACTDRPIVVVSWGPKAAGYTLELSHWTQQLNMMSMMEQRQGSRGGQMQGGRGGQMKKK